jgi:hypothetical protein
MNPLYRRAAADGLILAGLVYLVWRWVIIGPQDGHVGADAYAYWAVDQAAPYTLSNAQLGAFLYPPPMLRLFAPFALLTWPQFWLLWTALLVATAMWLGGRRTLLVLAFPPIALELYYGNINLLIAAAVALGYRYPATWAFVLLTKITPGVGLVWFAVRREWRPLAIALGATAIILAVSVLTDGALWSIWITAMVRDAPTDLGRLLAFPLVFRLPVAVAIAAWGARTDRAWTVPVAAAVAMPVLWIAGLSVLASIAAINRPLLRPRAMAKVVGAERSGRVLTQVVR